MWIKVSGYLRYQALQDRPDVEELKKLANSVEEFTTCLIDPLKTDTRDREAFGDSLDLIIDKAIEYNQGKVSITTLIGWYISLHFGLSITETYPLGGFVRRDIHTSNVGAKKTKSLDWSFNFHFKLFSCK